MAGHYTTKTEITYEDYLKLKGLLAIAADVVRESERLTDAVAGIIGEDAADKDGHAGDAVYGSHTAESLLKLSGIAILPPPEPAPHA